jgi:hypothetical protein
MEIVYFEKELLVMITNANLKERILKEISNLSLEYTKNVTRIQDMPSGSLVKPIIKITRYRHTVLGTTILLDLLVRFNISSIKPRYGNRKQSVLYRVAYNETTMQEDIDNKIDEFVKNCILFFQNAHSDMHKIQSIMEGANIEEDD